MSILISYLLIGLIMAIGSMLDEVPSIWRLETFMAWLTGDSKLRIIAYIVIGCIVGTCAYILGWPWIMYCDVTREVDHGESSDL